MFWDIWRSVRGPRARHVLRMAACLVGGSFYKIRSNLSTRELLTSGLNKCDWLSLFLEASKMRILGGDPIGTFELSLSDDISCLSSVFYLESSAGNFGVNEDSPIRFSVLTFKGRDILLTFSLSTVTLLVMTDID